MIANRTGKVIDYVLERERELPEAERTVFQLRTLSRKGTAIIQDSLVGYDLDGAVITSRPGSGAYVACKLGIAGWRNMHDEEGNLVRPRHITGKAAKRGTGLPALSAQSLDALPQYAIDELGSKIIELNGLTQAETEADEDDEQDPTASSPTPSASSSSPPSAPTMPRSATASSDSSERARAAPADRQRPAPRLATDARAEAG